MPDRRTVYTTSDGTGRAFYKFRADTEGDLSAGTLYAARATQQGPVGGDPANVSFELEWVELGHATDAEIEEWIAAYDDITQAEYTQGTTSYITDAQVRRWARKKRAGKSVPEELRKVPFLEARKAAGTLGATDEFRKMEGVNIKRDATPGDYAYVAMSNTNQTMRPNAATKEYDDPEDQIQLNGNEWGAVYRMKLLPRSNRNAAHAYDIRHMEPVVTGGPNANICGGCPYDARPDSASTVCQDCQFNPKKETEAGIVGKGMKKIETVFTKQGFDPSTTIAEPDNIVVMDDGRVVIGEDTGNAGHENNMIWVYTPGNEQR